VLDRIRQTFDVIEVEGLNQRAVEVTARKARLERGQKGGK
jgi:hypothetical protein